MIQIRLEDEEMELELHGSDELILKELSIAIVRMLRAMAMSNGNPVRKNLATLVLKLLADTEGDS